MIDDRAKNRSKKPTVQITEEADGVLTHFQDRRMIRKSDLASRLIVWLSAQESEVQDAFLDKSKNPTEAIVRIASSARKREAPKLR